jgi:hypothetical protein
MYSLLTILFFFLVGREIEHGPEPEVTNHQPVAVVAD